MAFTYSIVDGFSIAFLLILFISTRDKSVRLTDIRCFRLIVMMTIIALAGDMMAWQLDGREGMLCRWLLWIVNILCYLLSGAMTLTWFYYTALKMNRLGRISHYAWALIAFPFFFLTAVSVLTPWTHWLFYLDESNTYQRGVLFAIQMIIPFGYILASALWAMRQAMKERLRQQRLDYFYLASFILFPLIGGILQLAIYGVSLAWPCAALSLMMVYVGMQNQKISLDALTGLNNRGQFDKYLYGCMEHADEDLTFALFMLDIDEFKKINDTFGHTAGDAALIDAASVLKKALADTNSFLARYGGDEFAVVFYYHDEEQIHALLSRISEEAELCSGSDSSPYRLVFSVGYVCYDRHRYSNYQDMITAADAHMYIQKRQHKDATKAYRSDCPKIYTTSGAGMNQKFNLENYLSDGVDSLVKQALHATRLNPRQSAFLAKYAIASKSAAAKRAKFHKNGEHIPPFLIASITSQCNLHCAGCYARAESTCVDRTPICQLSDTEWKQVFEESAALGISFILLAGGEPLMRRDVLLEAGRLPEIFFPIFTNGTMLDEAYTRLFRQYRNLMPVLSVEGSAEITDARRGSGVFQQLVTAMELLQQNRILFGTSITVTTQTLKDVTSDAFIQMLCDKGCSVVFFVEYVPVTPDSLQLAPGDAQRQYMNARLQELRRIFSDRIFISFPGDEKATGGCVAAGRGFFHINSHGGAEPCPFSPYSDCNVRDTSVREALRSPLFRSLQDGGILMAEHDGGCILFEQKTRVEALLSQS